MSWFITIAVWLKSTLLHWYPGLLRAKQMSGQSGIEGHVTSYPAITIQPIQFWLKTELAM